MPLLSSCISSGVTILLLQRYVSHTSTSTNHIHILLTKMTSMAPNVSIYDHGMHLMVMCVQISRPRYSSPYSWPLNHILAYQKQWEIRRKMNAIGWSGKNLEQVFFCVQINEV